MSIDRRRMSGEYLPLRDAMERLFAGSIIAPQSFGGEGTFPPADVYVTDEEVMVELAVPGVKQEDLSISVTGDTVTLSGEVQRGGEREKGQAFLQEIWQGKFQRSFRLPLQVDADNATASMEDGILSLHLPKSEATRPRKIQIGGQGGSNQAAHTIEGQVERETVTPKPF
jgi:HSP20 family protein